MQDDVDDDVPRLYDHPMHIVQYNQLQLSDDKNWQEFIQHTHLHSLGVPCSDGQG